MDTEAWIGAISGIATAVGVLFAGVQLMLAKRQARTDFEDTLNREYRETVRTIPVSALLGESLSDELLEQHLPDFYRYIDLTNEQVFLRAKNRISRKTWVNWVDGIKDNLQRPAFAKAWLLIKSSAKDSFEELRALEKSKFKDDPRHWG